MWLLQETGRKSGDFQGKTVSIEKKVDEKEHGNVYEAHINGHRVFWNLHLIGYWRRYSFIYAYRKTCGDGQNKGVQSRTPVTKSIARAKRTASI